jgi:hypothetical protein
MRPPASRATLSARPGVRRPARRRPSTRRVPQPQGVRAQPPAHVARPSPRCFRALCRRARFVVPAQASTCRSGRSRRGRRQRNQTHQNGHPWGPRCSPDSHRARRGAATEPVRPRANPVRRTAPEGPPAPPCVSAGEAHRCRRQTLRLGPGRSVTTRPFHGKPRGRPGASPSRPAPSAAGYSVARTGPRHTGRLSLSSSPHSHRGSTPGLCWSDRHSLRPLLAEPQACIRPPTVLVPESTDRPPPPPRSGSMDVV